MHAAIECNMGESAGTRLERGCGPLLEDPAPRTGRTQLAEIPEIALLVISFFDHTHHTHPVHRQFDL